MQPPNVENNTSMPHSQPVMVGATPQIHPQQVMVGATPQMMTIAPSTNATTALVLSIIGIVLVFFYGIGICFAIPALILANGALNITNQFPNHPDAGTAKAAKVVSWVAIGVTLSFVVLVVLAGVLYVWASGLAPN
jgi:hypothetical protein